MEIRLRMPCCRRARSRRGKRESRAHARAVSGQIRDAVHHRERRRKPTQEQGRLSLNNRIRLTGDFSVLPALMKPDVPEPPMVSRFNCSRLPPASQRRPTGCLQMTGPVRVQRRPDRRPSESPLPAHRGSCLAARRRPIRCAAPHRANRRPQSCRLRVETHRFAVIDARGEHDFHRAIAAHQPLRVLLAECFDARPLFEMQLNGQVSRGRGGPSLRFRWRCALRIDSTGSVRPAARESGDSENGRAVRAQVKVQHLLTLGAL